MLHITVKFGAHIHGYTAAQREKCAHVDHIDTCNFNPAVLIAEKNVFAAITHMTPEEKDTL